MRVPLCHCAFVPTVTRKRVRVSIDVDTAARQRLCIAAAVHDQSIRDYAWEAIQERLDRDGIPDQQASDPPALHGDADPVLEHLWNNSDDERYDDL